MKLRRICGVTNSKSGVAEDEHGEERDAAYAGATGNSPTTRGIAAVTRSCARYPVDLSAWYQGGYPRLARTLPPHQGRFFRRGAIHRAQALVIPAYAGIPVPPPQRGDHRGARPEGLACARAKQGVYCEYMYFRKRRRWRTAAATQE